MKKLLSLLLTLALALSITLYAVASSQPTTEPAAVVDRPPSELPLTGDTFPLSVLLALFGILLTSVVWLGFRMKERAEN